MIAGNYADLIMTMDLFNDVLGHLKGDQPDMVESRRGIVRAAQRSHYQTLVATSKAFAAGEDKLLRIGLEDPVISQLNDACGEFITTFTKYLKKAGVEDAEVQRVVDLVPVKPLGRRKVSVSLSLGGQN
ncbi:Ff.00g049250.m01.CDS01 [Fusarium sp. VM40]|nr:Ff.00g049250.m01.CDS01 [Fusarium sp. VM40]